MKDDLILRLNSEKLRLEQEVVDLKERLSKRAEKQVKSGKHQQNTNRKKADSWQSSVEKSERIYKCNFYYT